MTLIPAWVASWSSRPLCSARKTDGMFTCSVPAANLHPVRIHRRPPLAVYERNIVPGPNFGQLTLLEVEIDGVNDEDDSGLEVEGLVMHVRWPSIRISGIFMLPPAHPDPWRFFRRDTLAGSAQFGQVDIC